MIVVRAETETDHERVFEIEAAAFAGRFEPELVDALRRDAAPTLSLVAERAGALVGHIFFSPVELAVQRPGHAFGALAPVAVEPSAQGLGVGSALVREGLGRCRALGWRAVFLVGDPRYYARFGFELAASRGFSYGEPLFDAVLQVVELVSGGLEGCTGRVLYAPAFGQERAS